MGRFSCRVASRVLARAILRVGLLVVASCGLATLIACGASKKPVIKDCILQDDQSGTMEGKWGVTPVQVALHSGSNWSPDELDAFIQAADVWNAFYKESQGIDKMIDYGDPNSPRASSLAKPSNVCLSSIASNNKFSGSVVIYKDGKWPAGYPSTAIAITGFCRTGDGSNWQKSSFFNGMMEVNYQNFFVAGTKVPDLQSIFIHELGHLIGLDHSCELQAKPNRVGNMPLCTDSALPVPYFDAVMFPKIFFDSSGAGEQRRALQENDQGRANCLYQGAKPAGT